MPTKKPTSKKKTPARKPVAAKRTVAAPKTTTKKTVANKATAKKAVVKKSVTKEAAPKVAARRTATRPAVRAVPTIVRRTAKAAQATTPASRAARAAGDPNRYAPSIVEPKWQAKWAADGLYNTNLEDDSKKKFYFVTMYPYPSGDLHIGHWYAMAPSDAGARFRRMQGYNVFFPMGFDAFGLPAENAAIKRGVHPYKWTMRNMENMRRQMRSMGAMFDWSHEVVTCNPEYYKWNQWFFLQFFKAGLAYKKMAPVDWCPKDQTVLAREQVVGAERLCERCGTPVIKRDLEQWFFRITQYVDELLDFSKMQWPERVRSMQTNWIGRSEGAEINFPVLTDDGDQQSAISDQSSANGEAASNGWPSASVSHRPPYRPAQTGSSVVTGDVITCFSTRPDTLFGATFIVLAPEHPLVEKLTAPERRAEVEQYVFEARRKTEIDREAADKDKSGLFIGAYAQNPLNGARMPIWIADYVLMGYGTGAIMGVPAHDTRDWDFATKYQLPIVTVIAPPDWDGSPQTEVYTGEGLMVNSGEFDGTPSLEGIHKVAEKLEQIGAGKAAITYRIRDWLISRQRYWGTPIPIIYCPDHGIVPVAEKDLPVVLPVDDSIKFNPEGQSPLLQHAEFLNTTCPICGKPSRRETDTMDTFVDSSWYQFRYLNPHSKDMPFERTAADKWTPVDQYTGGIEHAVMHLLYTRFFNKAIRDTTGLTEADEPMQRLFNQGIILAPIEKPGERARKMSKSKGNVVAPDPLVQRYGADTVRAFLMFIGPWDQGGPWDDSGIDGVRKWINRVWSLVVEQSQASPNGQTPSPNATEEQIKDLRRTVHQSIKRVGDDMESFKYNTAISGMMELTNALVRAKESAWYPDAIWGEAVSTLLLLMAPITPHVAEELWARVGGTYSIHQQMYPKYDARAAAEEQFTLIVQINGKVRDRAQAAVGISEETAKALALATEGAQKYLEGKPPRQVIYVKGKLVNIVV